MIRPAATQPNLSSNFKSFLEITRKVSFLGVARPGIIFIDGQSHGMIADGQTVVIPLPPGRYVIRMRFGLTKGRASYIHIPERGGLRLTCALKLNLPSNEFILADELGVALPGDAGPADHHGFTLLAFALSGVVVGAFGLLALVLGIRELRRIDNGKIDPRGRWWARVAIVLGGLVCLANLIIWITIIVMYQHR